MPEETQRLAIVGMDVWLPGCDGLDAFDQRVYDGERWPAVDHPQKSAAEREELLARILERALATAGAFASETVAAIVQVRSEAASAASLWSPALLPRLEPLLVAPSAEPPPALADSARRIVARLCRRQTDAGGLLALRGEGHAVFQLIEIARGLLAQPQVEAVALGTVEEQDLAAAVVLQTLATARASGRRVYAVIDAIGFGAPGDPVAERTQRSAGITAQDVGYLELVDAGVFAEGPGLFRSVWDGGEHFSCAVGCLAEQLGGHLATVGLAGLIKVALCLYHRYLPAWPGWRGPVDPQAWEGSPFYVPSEASPWFAKGMEARRLAALDSTGPGGAVCVLLSEEPQRVSVGHTYLQRMPQLLFALAAADCEGLRTRLMRLRSAVDDAPPATLAARCHGDDGELALALIAANRSELCREIDLALAGLDATWASGEAWQTPAGSYFTPRPLGRTGKVAFVYPGGINAYLGLGRHLFRLFPEIHDDPAVRSAYSRIGKIDRALYPRSLKPLTLRELEALEQHLNRDLAIMFESGVGIACVVTTLMQRYFRLEPHCHFGYSLGEVSMVCAQGIWSDVGALSARLDRSPLFSHRLSGPKETVRRYWSLADDLPDDSFWGVFIVLAPLSEVLWRLKGEERVFLTHINTPGELVIAGDPQACRRVIADLQCEALRAPFGHVVHCPPVREEYDALVHLHTGTVDRRPDASFYSAAEYAPLALDSASLARSLTEVLCQPLDFPRLIEQVYADGVRIFIELGPGGSCCRWISESLKSQEFLAVSLNRRGVHDHLTILRALARLFSHRVDLDLSALYPGATPKEKTMTPAVLTRTADVPAPSSTPAERDRFLDAQVRALCDNVASANRASLAFLQMRREALQAVGTLIRKQLEAQ